MFETIPEDLTGFLELSSRKLVLCLRELSLRIELWFEGITTNWFLVLQMFSPLVWQFQVRALSSKRSRFGGYRT